MITSNEHFLIRNRNLRCELLKQTDYLLLQDNYEKLTEEQKLEILNYREQLRNFINIHKEDYLIKGIAYIDFPVPPSWTNIKNVKY